MNRRGTPAVAICCALFCCLAATAWMQFVAVFDYGENWTAFYRTGSSVTLPAIAARENIFLLKGGGYDGQYYRLIAQDPLLLHGTAQYLDAARLRYRRILVPALAWLAAGGSATTVTRTYPAIVILFLGWGAYWLSRLAVLTARSGWWGIAFPFIPGAFLSLDRLTVDIALTALTVSFAYYLKSNSLGKLYLVLVLATLAKETGFLLLAAFVLHALYQKQWVRPAIFATAGLPAIIWFLYVQLHTTVYATAWIQLPFTAVWQAMFHPELCAVRRWYIVPLDYLAWAGMLLAILLAILRATRDNALSYAALFFAVLASLIDFNVWQEVEGFGRAFTPLLILSPMIRPDWMSILPLLLVLPRALVFPVSETLHALVSVFMR